MSLLLACVATDLEAALQLAAILTRSRVPFGLHTGHLPVLSGEGDNVFHIVVIDHADSRVPAITLPDGPLSPAAVLTWLKRQDPLRYLATYTPGSTDSSSAAMGLADVWLGELADPDKGWIAHWPTHAAALCCQSTDHWTHTIDVDTIVAGVESIHTALSELPGQVPDHSSAQLPDHGRGHVFFDCQADDVQSLLNVARGTEGIRLLCGPPVIGEHLPALFRIRGWLTTAQQLADRPSLPGTSAVISSEVSDTSDSAPVKRDDTRSHTGITKDTLLADSVLITADTLNNQAALIKQLQTLLERGTQQWQIAGVDLARQVIRALDTNSFQVHGEAQPGSPWLLCTAWNMALALTVL